MTPVQQRKAILSNVVLLLVTVEAVNVCVDGVVTALVVTAGWEVVRIVVDDRGALTADNGQGRSDGC